MNFNQVLLLQEIDPVDPKLARVLVALLNADEVGAAEVPEVHVYVFLGRVDNFKDFLFDLVSNDRIWVDVGVDSQVDPGH